MPKLRIGFTTDFNLNNSAVGVGTTNPTAKLDVRGQIRADHSAGSGGISTFAEYQGFLHNQQGIGNTVSIAQTTKGSLNSLSGEIKLTVGEITIGTGSSLTGGRVESLTVTSTFDLPTGGSANREETPEKGSTRFNQDLGQLEFYTGYEWRTVSSYDGSGRGRAVIAHGYTPVYINTYEFVNISTLGNSSYFGNQLVSVREHSACSSETRGLFGGGGSGPVAYTNVIEYVTIAAQGNGIDFGDLVNGANVHNAACSSSTRGIWGGGYNPGLTNSLEYVQIQTLGNSIDFGDLTETPAYLASLSSPVRGIYAGGTLPGVVVSRGIDFITISSTGNSKDFGNLTSTHQRPCGASNSIRGFVFGGTSTSMLDISMITISTLGNSSNFGNLISADLSQFSTANNTRAIIGGGNSISNTIQYITISTAGNAQDFGDLSLGGSSFINACSDSHGGLGGF